MTNSLATFSSASPLVSELRFGRSSSAAPIDDVVFSTALRSKLDGASAQEKARSAAEEFVAGSLVLPVLQQLRKTNQAASPFQPGLHEKVFTPMADAELASRIVRSQNFPLVDAVTKSLLKEGV